jgi:hypothetical protein
VSTGHHSVELTYLVPLRADDDTDLHDLVDYLRRLARSVDDVLVVDNSEPEHFVRHRAQFGPAVRVIRPELETANGKVGNVVTGVHHARGERVMIADDDVRYELGQLADVARRLDRAAIVRPQNYFRPLPWHARFDTARTLLNRVATGDWPGTLAVRRSAFVDAGCYRGDVMFENLELVRTLQAAGHRESLALDVLVERRPPSARHFWRQQVRQAYDEFARPHRLVVSLALLPAAVVAIARRRSRALAAAALWCGVMAELGRRRAGGRAVFPATSSLLAGPWLLWRSACSWGALVARLRGGVEYRGTRLRDAASSPRALRRRQSPRVTGLAADRPYQGELAANPVARDDWHDGTTSARSSSQSRRNLVSP